MRDLDTTPDAAAAPWVIGALSLFVVTAVALVVYVLPKHAGVPGEPTPLATLNALLNGSAGCFLLVGYRFIRRRRIAAHRLCMSIATGLSSIFLVTYLLHHAQVGSVPFRGEGVLRPIYFAILIPHVLLAAAIVPLALFTLYRGVTGRIAGHRRIARITLPLWLYVSVSGVVVYWMLYHL
jgi:putative membrane protein